MGITPNNIIRLQEFSAVMDVEVVINITQVLLLMPIFRWTGDHWIDAVGDYDLCMDVDNKYYNFFSRRTGTTLYAYRYITIPELVGRP